MVGPTLKEATQLLEPVRSERLDCKGRRKQELENVSKPTWGGEKPTAPRRGRWSTEEVAQFREMYGLRDDRTIARELKRSLASVRSMAESLYEGEPKQGPWSDEEVQNLRHYLGASTMQALCRVLGRSQDDVQAKVAELALIRKEGEWDHEDLGDFKRLYGTRTNEDLAIIFGRGLAEIESCASRLCLSKDKAFLRRQTGGKATTRMPRWQASELEQLRRLYPQSSNLDIAKLLNRSVKSIVSKAHNLGLKKDPSRLKEMGRQNVGLRYSRAAMQKAKAAGEDPAQEGAPESDAAPQAEPGQPQAAMPEEITPPAPGQHESVPSAEGPTPSAPADPEPSSAGGSLSGASSSLPDSLDG